LGYRYEDVLDCGYEAFTDLLLEEDYARTMDAMRDLLEGRAPLYQVDYRTTHSSKMIPIGGPHSLKRVPPWGQRRPAIKPAGLGSWPSFLNNRVVLDGKFQSCRRALEIDPPSDERQVESCLSTINAHRLESRDRPRRRGTTTKRKIVIAGALVVPAADKAVNRRGSSAARTSRLPV
jgi:hypothetical protein